MFEGQQVHNLASDALEGRFRDRGSMSSVVVPGGSCIVVGVSASKMLLDTIERNQD